MAFLDMAAAPRHPQSCHASKSPPLIPNPNPNPHTKTLTWLNVSFTPDSELVQPLPLYRACLATCMLPVHERLFFLYSEHECGWIDTGSVANGLKIPVDVLVNAFAVTALNLSHILAL